MYMAPGKHGGYRKHEFRDREFDINVSRRGDFYYSVEEFGRYSNEGSQRQVRYESCKLEQGKERVNGGYYSSSSSNNSGSSKRGRSSMKVADREPGELSSESGSDGADMSELQVRKNEDWEPKEAIRLPAARKRKISPIIWDGEEKHLSNLARHKSKGVSPHPQLPQGFCRFPNSNQNESADSAQLSPIQPRSSHSLEQSPVKPQVGPMSDSQTGHPIALRPEVHQSGGQELGNVQEDEDYVPMRNISASRWAIGNNSPKAQEEGEVYDGEQVNTMKKKTPQPDLVSMNLKTTIQNLGDRESTRESIEGARVKSSDSDGEGHQVGSASEIEYTDTDFDRNDFMEVDSKDLKRDVNSFHTKTYCEENSDETPESLVPPQRSINMLQGCRNVHEFEKMNRIDEGTYGVVFRAKDKKTGEIVALKKVKMAKEKEGFPLTSLREINILLSLHHPSIVDVKEVVVGSNLDSIFMAMEYMEHDLKGLMETMRQPFSQSEVKCLMKQLLEGVYFLHENWVLHRDLKTSNLLFNNNGQLKICDFGLSRHYGSPLKPYTPLVVTLWYRAPELLLGAKQYSTAIDMWSLGCIMAELLAKEPLFNGNGEIEQIRKIFETLGMPNEKIWPGFSQLPGAKIKVNKPYKKLRDKFPPTPFSGRPTLSEAGFDLLNKFLTYDPEKRITAKDALDHDWFREVPLPKSKDFMPTFPAQHAQDRRMRRTMKSPDPLEELRRKEAQQRDARNSLFG